MTLNGCFNPEEFVRDEIEKLRLGLLDFTLRNRLLSFKHPDRGADYIRVIDESPTSLFRHLSAGGVTCKPLPDLAVEPRDESTVEFRAALAAVRREEAANENPDAELPDDAASPNAQAKRERRLRDKVRAAVGLEPILLRGGQVDLAALARAHGIVPDCELASPRSPEHEEHSDKVIQTLLLQDVLDRRLRKVYEVYQDHIQEKGINVLHAAIAFLEWYEDDDSDVAHHAPLLLVPLTILRESEFGQPVYKLSAESGDAEVNVTLLEFLKQKHHLTLPGFEAADEAEQGGEDDTDGLEAWLVRVGDALIKKRRWCVRRFVTIGAFPFSRIALYNDLAADGWTDNALLQHALVGRLLGGRGAESQAGPSAGTEDYRLDRADFPLPVPSLVLEADSSQHSAIVDAMAGASFVVQGPPGTGKSQTIANIIAAALDAGKTVLFMAEKSAALNVVSSRLKDRGLGPFLFEVHSDKVRKSEVLAALRERLEMPAPKPTEELKRKLAQRRAHRDKLARYVELMGQPVGRLGRPLYDLMWLVNRQSDDLLPRIPNPLLDEAIPHASGIDQQQLDGYRENLDALVRARHAIVSCGRSISSHPWRMRISLEPAQLAGR